MERVERLLSCAAGSRSAGASLPLDLDLPAYRAAALVGIRDRSSRVSREGAWGFGACAWGWGL